MLKTNKKLQRRLLRMTQLYAITVNVAYVVAAAMGGMWVTDTGYLYVAASVPVIMTMAQTLGLCRLYKFAIINPLLLPALTLVTHESWHVWLTGVAIVETLFLILWLFARWGVANCSSKNTRGGDFELIINYL